MNYRFFLIFLLAVILPNSYGAQYPQGDESTVFSGYVSRINKKASLIRIKINFENAKYLNKNNRVEFWSELYPERKCKSYLKGRSSNYLLVRVTNYNECAKKVSFAVGSYLRMGSPDLENNLEIGRELVKVLHRKRTALSARKSRYEQDLTVYIEKIDAVNKRYEVLRQKLELEWKKELADLEEDKLQSFEELRRTNSQLNDVEYKMQQYRIRDQNLIEDRWSLDPELFTKR